MTSQSDMLSGVSELLKASFHSLFENQYCVEVSKMETHYKSIYLLIFVVIITLLPNSKADVHQTCLCTTEGIVYTMIIEKIKLNFYIF